MRIATFNVQLDATQIRGIVNQLSDEEKLNLANELIAEIRRNKLAYFQQMFQGDGNLPTMEEIQEEVNVVRQERYEQRKRD